MVIDTSKIVKNLKHWKPYVSTHHVVHVQKSISLFPLNQASVGQLADDIHDAIEKIFPEAKTDKKIHIYISKIGGNFGQWPHMITLEVTYGHAFSANMLLHELYHSAQTRMSKGKGDKGKDHNAIKRGILGRIQRKMKPWYLKWLWFRGIDTRG